MKRLIILMVIFIIFMMNSFSYSSELNLTVSDCIEMALKNNKNIMIVRQEIEYADAQIKEAYGAALPVISLNAGSKHQDKVRTMTIPSEDGTIEIPTGKKDTYYGNITLTQPLWVGGKVGAAVDGAKLYEKYVTHTFENTKQQIVYAVKISCYTVMLADEMRDISEKALIQAENHFKQVKKLYDQGMASRFDLLRSEVAVSNSRPPYLEAENAYDLAVLKLKNIIGLPSEADIVISEEFRYIPEDLSIEEGLSTALENRQDLRALDIQVDMNRVIRKINYSDYYPSIFFNADYSASRDKTAKNDIYGELSAGLMLSWSFDFGTRGSVKQADIRIKQAIFQKEQLITDIEYEVKQAFLNLKEAEAVILSQEKTISMAEESLRIAEVRYQSGTGTHIEVTDAQFSLNMARTNYIQALYGYFVARTTIEKVIGIL